MAAVPKDTRPPEARTLTGVLGLKASGKAAARPAVAPRTLERGGEEDPLLQRQDRGGGPSSGWRGDGEIDDRPPLPGRLRRSRSRAKKKNKGKNHRKSIGGGRGRGEVRHRSRSEGKDQKAGDHPFQTKYHEHI